MAVAESLRLVGSIARVGATVAGERLRSRGPVTDIAEVPARIEELSVEWLTGALCAGVPGAHVTAFALGEGSDGTSSRRAVEVTYDEAGSAAGLPVHVYTKSTPTFVNRALIGVTGAAGAEALFYNRIRRELDIGAPAGYFGGWDPRTCRSMILIEDIVKTRGATFGSAVTYVDRAGAECMVREMARYHGGLWQDPRLDREWTDLLDAKAWQDNFNAKTAMDRGGVFAFRFAGDEIPAALKARAKEVRPAFARSMQANVALPQTLLHQDVHPGNWFRLPDGSLNLYDWQSVCKGSWALDFAYALTAGLDVEDRRAWERELLEMYLQLLGEAGGTPPSFDDAWLAYRQQQFHGLIFWTYTLLFGKVSELQPDDVVRMLVRRTAQAVVDLESLESV